MSLLSRLFGGKAEPETPKGEDYNGFTIYPEPMPEGKTFRLCARIEREIDGELKTHRLIRADTIDGQQAAIDASRNKAKQMIDQLGDKLFD